MFQYIPRYPCISRRNPDEQWKPHSNTAAMSLQRIIDYDSDGFIFSSYGPGGNICMMTRGSTQSCCSFAGAQFSRDSDACMIHFWLYAENTKVQIIDRGSDICLSVTEAEYSALSYFSRKKIFHYEQANVNPVSH